MLYKNLKLLHKFVCHQCKQSTSFVSKDFLSKNYYCHCSQLSIHHYHHDFSQQNDNIVAFAIFYINNFKVELISYLNPIGNIDTYNTNIYSIKNNNYYWLCSFNEFPNFFQNSTNITNYLSSISTFQ